jgi:hypothetical protein
VNGGRRKMKKVFLVFLVTLGLFIPMKGAEATHWYLWSDTNYAFWLDDQNIVTNNEKSWAAVKIIMEDMKANEYVTYPDPVIFYKVHGDWFVSMNREDTPKPVYDYLDWWQSYAADWLIKYGYLKE